MTDRDHVADSPELHHVAETCRGERQDGTPPQPPAAGVTLTDDEREVLESLVFVARLYATERTAGVIQRLLERLGKANE
jgi:hypothetical protein